jgi:DNA-directed RNA polymerase sigma subunit (sigma70/sigma32)
MTSDERYMLWYKAEIDAVAPLSLDEEHTCIGHIRACDELAISARERLVEAHLSVVVGIAETYGDAVVHVPELLADGNQALVAAVDTFCESGEPSFKAYVARLVEQAISRAAMPPVPRVIQRPPGE